MSFEKRKPKTVYERVVGDVSDNVKEKILKKKSERFDNQVFEELKDVELKKTPEELKIIALANEVTNELRRQYGLADFDIPPDNIHVIKEEDFRRSNKHVELINAFYSADKQGVAVRENATRLLIEFMHVMTHEMIHFKSYQALQFTKPEQGEDMLLGDYRRGVLVFTRDGKKGYFTNFNEAITEEMAKRLLKKCFGNSLFKQEMQEMKQLLASNPNIYKVRTESGKLLFNEDTYYVVEAVKLPKGLIEKLGAMFGFVESERKKILSIDFTYKPERKMLNTLIDKLFKYNQDQFNNREEVFKVFARGIMTGNILPLGRLIEKTFGNGTFRKIGELDADVTAQQFFIDSLKGGVNKNKKVMADFKAD